MLFCAHSPTLSGRAVSLFFIHKRFLYFYVARFSISERLTALLMSAPRCAAHISPYTSHLLKNAYMVHVCSSLFRADPMFHTGHPADAPRPRTVPPARLRAARCVGALACTGCRAFLRAGRDSPAGPAAATTDDATASSSAPLPPIHILAVQGHPEFPESVVAPLVSTRAASGAIDAPTAAAYEAHGRGVKDDGRGRIARAVWGVMRGEM